MHQVAEPVADRVEHGRLQRAGRGQYRHGVRHPGEGGLALRAAVELAGDAQDGVLACEQLAIHYERRAKDPARATEFVRLGLAKLQRMRANTRDPHAAARVARLAEKLIIRINRLEGKNKRKSANRAAASLSLLNSSAK